jgi:hypothetical protein
VRHVGAPIISHLLTERPERPEKLPPFAIGPREFGPLQTVAVPWGNMKYTGIG